MPLLHPRGDEELLEFVRLALCEVKFLLLVRDCQSRSHPPIRAEPTDTHRPLGGSARFR